MSAQPFKQRKPKADLFELEVEYFFRKNGYTVLPHSIERLHAAHCSEIRSIKTASALMLRNHPDFIVLDPDNTVSEQGFFYVEAKHSRFIERFAFHAYSAWNRVAPVILFIRFGKNVYWQYLDAIEFEVGISREWRRLDGGWYVTKRNGSGTPFKPISVQKLIEFKRFP